MAPRAKEKVKRATSRTSSKTPAASKAKAVSKTASAASKRPDQGAAPARLETRIKSLEQERDRLKTDLDAARMRIAALEESRSAVANRIDWVIERLGGVVERGD